MKKIIFVSACKTKKYKSGLAREMYVGQFSEKAYRYATKIDVEKDELVFLTPKGYWTLPTLLSINFFDFIII